MTGEVQGYYDEGHTIDECSDRFGFSYGAWDRAAVRGDIVSRPSSGSYRARRRVGLLLAEDRSPPRSQGSRHLEVDSRIIAGGWDGADSRFHGGTTGLKFQRAINKRRPVECAGALARFGFCRAHLVSRPSSEETSFPRPAKIPIEELLVVGRKATNRTHLKTRLIGEGLKENRCEVCGITEWRGKPSACSCITSTATAMTIGWRIFSCSAATATRRPTIGAAAASVARADRYLAG